jgi:hypothetical protein
MIVQNICRTIFILSICAAIVQYYYITFPEIHIILIIYESIMMFLLLVQYFLTYKFMLSQPRWQCLPLIHNLIIFSSLMMTLICLMMILLDRKAGVIIAYAYTVLLSTFMFITNELICTVQLLPPLPPRRQLPQPPAEDEDSLVNFTDSLPLIEF